MLIPAPMYDPSDQDQSIKNLGIKIKKNASGKPIAPSADQVQRAFIKKQKKIEQQRLKDGFQKANNLGIENIGEFTEILKNESKQFIEDLKEEIKDIKDLVTEK